jgi:putative ABC transport system permease protein
MIPFKHFYREIKLGIKNLVLRGTRSLLTMLGMVFGVGSVIAMLAVGEGASKEALEQIRMLGSNNIMVYSVKPAEEGGQQSVRTRLSIYGLQYEDEKRMAESFSDIKRTVPVKILQQEGRVGEKAMEIRVVGTTPDWFDLVRRPILAGRKITKNDIANRNNVVVLTDFTARQLLAGEEVLGQYIRIAGNYFEVVGVIASYGSDTGTLQTPDQLIDAYIPLTTMQERYGDVTVRRAAGSRIRERVELHQIIVQVNDISHVEKTAAGIESMLGQFHKKVDYRLQVPLALLRQAEATKRTFNIVLGSIAAISLLVGGIGIMNIMLASVTERTREIGIRRAIGAKKIQVVGQFLIETMVLSTTGGLLGIIIGFLIPWFITVIAGLPTIITPMSIILSLAISMAVGIIFGLYPARRAASLDPIEALRHE